ncbi:TetR/AcrR family transcriptional regulator [Planomonospora sp. ID67723]|uniref:TetR/AcrR family transcriptional regulator n=1 Tax=Planomonospora sp. ID67723 TaxID=2738134 RepID=UPI0018C3A102|nr:TetR/AcrR family transcriptional regulator [Planomonospora sp. ID67723]MBG0827597.1 TetR/AcrR family transcriptional regulator [Planomonospora sp. ID67723]
MADPFFVDERDPPSKRRILTEALRLFVERGVDGTTVRDIARASGYTNPALFKFFATKDELALHLFGRCYAHLHDRAALACAPGRPFDERLGSLLRAFGAILDGEPEAFLYVQDNLRIYWPRLPPAERKASLIELMRALLRDGVAEGRVTASVPTDLMVAAISGTVAQYARMRHFGELSSEEVDTALKPLISRMIAV